MFWQGLGYYSRAHRIHKASKQLLQITSSKDLSSANTWPNTMETWVAIPGIGRTTAASILSSAFNVPEAILDANELSIEII